MVDQDLELYGRQRAEGEGFVLLALPAFLPSANLPIFTQSKGGRLFPNIFQWTCMNERIM